MRLMRLVLVAGLFVGWLGYLGYLVATRPRFDDGWPLVLSRPQVLASDLDVIAELPEPGQSDEVEVTIVKVLYPRNSSLKEGDTIRVSHLGECHPLPRGKRKPPSDWSGAGRYLLPLEAVPGKTGHYSVAAIPPSPGFEYSEAYRIYPATPEIEAQYEEIGKRPPAPPPGKEQAGAP